MPALTRRRSTDAREECWHIYYGACASATRLTLTLGMDLRVLPRQSPPRVHERHLGNVRTGPYRLRSGMGSVFIEADPGRFPGVARTTGMDCREVPPLRSRRAHAAGLEAAVPVLATSWLSRRANLMNRFPCRKAVGSLLCGTQAITSPSSRRLST